MNSIEKNIVKLFLEISVPNEFLNSPDKILFDEFLKGKCTIFLKSSKIDNDTFLKIVSLKNQLTKDINYQWECNLFRFYEISNFYYEKIYKDKLTVTCISVIILMIDICTLNIDGLIISFLYI